MLSVNGLLLQVNKHNVGKIVSKIKMLVTTTVDEVDIKTSCRVCLMKHQPDKLFCLFGNNSMFQDLSIATAIRDCFGVELKEDVQLPNYVCIKCASSTLQSYTFKKCLERCQGLLQKQKAAKVVGEERRKNDEDKENKVKGLQRDNHLSHNIVLQQEQLESSGNENLAVSADCTDSKRRVELLLHVVADHNYACEKTKGSTKTEPFDDVITIPSADSQNKDNVENSINSNSNLLKTMEGSELKMVKLKKSKNSQMVKKVRKKRSEDNIITPSKVEWWSKSAGPPYECKICNRNYGCRFRAFYMHSRIHRAEKLPCIICSKRFLRYRMSIHLQSHTNEQPHGCTVCSARFSIKGNLQRHMRCHTGEKLYVCDVCGKAFTQSTTLLNHKQTHERKTRSVCVYCGKTFISDSSHRKHLYIYHSDRKANKSAGVKQEGDTMDKYSCDTCGRVFIKLMALRIHERSHDRHKYNCGLCKRIYTSSVNYRVHQFWHEVKMMEWSETQGTDCSCRFCNVTFNEKSDLLTHLFSHMEKQFLCNYCGKRFVTSLTLHTHVRRHSDDRPFSCTECVKTFRCTATLRQHVKVHTGEKPYKCEVCLRLFTQKQQLVSHTLTHSGEKKHVCPFCGKAFALNGNLTVHKRRHTGETPYVCDVCGRGFYDSSSMKKHKDFQHRNKMQKT